MLPSVALGLFALLRRIRCISGNVLKSFILRCLGFWPHLIRSLRYIWSLFSERTGSPKDVLKKKGGQARLSFPRASGVCEEYSTICASLDFNTAVGFHLQTGPDNAEARHSIVTIGQLQSAPHSPASSLRPSLPGSPHHSDRHFPVDNTSIFNADDIPLPPTLHLNPLTFTHSRITSTQFAGVPRRSRSRSPSTYPHSHSYPTLESSAPSPGHFRSPSPFLSPQPHLI